MKLGTFIAAAGFMITLLLFSSCKGQNDENHARRTNLDENWQFHYGEIEEAPESDMAGHEGWRPVNLPHDWSIEMPFSKDSEGGKATGHFPGGTGWYLKTFTLEQWQQKKRLNLYFEGAYMETEIWVNGQKATYHPYGYTSFFCDITPYCKFPGESNTLAVKVSNKGKNSRWYSGSGIYRHVWLETTDPVYIEPWGTYITSTDIKPDLAEVKINAEISNSTNKILKPEVEINIFDPSGNIAGSSSEKISIDAGKKVTVAIVIKVSDPLLWSVDSPSIYNAVVSLRAGTRYYDSFGTTFGIRSISFSAENGFLLNGRQIKLKGGCVHHDNGFLGSAAIDRADERKAELLKANGFNAVRCAHNPPSEKFLEACDRVGLLVIDEAFDHWQKPKNPEDYHRFFNEWHVKDIESMVLRDRNHPSVIMWSIGNEIQERVDSSGLAIARELKSIVKKNDPTRPVTAAICEFWDNPGKSWKDTENAFEVLDVGGYNYQWRNYEKDHAIYPGRIMNGTESTAMERASNWDLVEKYPYILGDFIWTAIDYLGESGIGNTRYSRSQDKEVNFRDWPWFNAWCGDIDLTGNKKPQCAIRDILWGNSKIEMLIHSPVPSGSFEKVSYWGWPDEIASWNWKGSEGRLMQVRVFTRYPAVRLYLNGKVVGEDKVISDGADKYTVRFRISYKPGTLKAVGLDGGLEKDSIILVTAGKVSGIELNADRINLKASKNDLSYVQISLRDNSGNLVQDDDMKLNISVSGEGTIAASGNSAPDDMESFRSLTPKTFRGRALVILRPSGKPGTMTLKVSADGLPEVSTNIIAGAV